MISLGIKIGADLKKFKPENLIQLFGESGRYFYNIAHGRDDSPVEPSRIRKSIGKKTTLPEDIDDQDRRLKIMERIAARLESLLIRHEARGRTITLKIKYFDFQSVTRSVTVDESAINADIIMKHIKPLPAKIEAGAKKVRLPGISILNFFGREKNVGKNVQLPLPFKFFRDPTAGQHPW